MSPLPLSLDQLKSSLSSSFPYIIDLGHLMKEFNPNGNIKNVPAASSFLRSRFFAPIDIDIPLEGKLFLFDSIFVFKIISPVMPSQDTSYQG